MRGSETRGKVNGRRGLSDTDDDVGLEPPRPPRGYDSTSRSGSLRLHQGTAVQKNNRSKRGPTIPSSSDIERPNNLSTTPESQQSRREQQWKIDDAKLSALKDQSRGLEAAVDSGIALNYQHPMDREGKAPEKRDLGTDPSVAAHNPSLSRHSNSLARLEAPKTKTQQSVPNDSSPMDAPMQPRPGAHRVGGFFSTDRDSFTITDQSSTSDQVNHNVVSQNVGSAPMVTASVVDPDLLEAQIQERVDREANERVERIIVSAQATAVRQTPSQELASTDVSGMSGRDAKNNKEQTRLLRLVIPIVCIALVVVGAAVGAVVAVLLTGSNNAASSKTSSRPVEALSEAPSVSPIAPSSAPSTFAIGRVERTVAEISLMERLRDPSSPQYAAIEWLANEDELFPTLPRHEQLERFVLVTMYFSTLGTTSWTRQARFLTPTIHVCDWNNVDSRRFGVFCDNTSSQNVTRIDLSELGLGGSLPPELGNLQSLQSLDLSANSIEGTMPLTLWEETQSLQVLNIGSNLLRGTIPPSIGLVGATLRYLDVRENKLEGTLPTEIGLLTHLETVFLNGNSRLGGTVPTEFGHLTSLQLAEFGLNRFEGSLPSEISNCRSLSSIGFHSNDLSSTVSQTLEALPANVAFVYFAFNNLTGPIPATLSAHTHLTHLNLRSNGVSGSIPSEVGQTTTLTQLDLFSNQLTGALPTELGLLGGLQLLNLANNMLVSTLPSELGALTQLTALDVADNSLTGSPGGAFAPISSLQYVALQGNDWTDIESVCGVIPDGADVSGNSCEEPNRFPCSCCTFCCTSPPYVELSCPFL